MTSPDTAHHTFENITPPCSLSSMLSALFICICLALLYTPKSALEEKIVLGYMIQPDFFEVGPYTRSMAMAFRHILSPLPYPVSFLSPACHIPHTPSSIFRSENSGFLLLI
jgi:hypothetical protein